MAKKQFKLLKIIFLVDNATESPVLCLCIFSGSASSNVSPNPGSAPSSRTKVPNSSSASQPADSAPPTAPQGRKKGARELTSFPPYSSPQSEKPPDSFVKKDGSKAQSQKVEKADSSANSTASVVSNVPTIHIDYGPAEPLLPLEEGIFSSFLVLFSPHVKFSLSMFSLYFCLQLI